MSAADHARKAEPVDAGAKDQAPSPSPQFDSRELFGGATEISIRHEQSIYRLRITRQGKLILNK